MQKQTLDLINFIDNLHIDESINIEKYDHGKLITKNELIGKLTKLKNIISLLPAKLTKVIEELQSSLDEDISYLDFHGIIEEKIIGDNDKVNYDKIYINSYNDFIDAIIVDSFDEVQSDGKIYYVEPNKHFAFYLNGRLYNGNIGEISKNYKLKTCTNEDCKTHLNIRNQCSFYHNPIIVSNSTEKRNYYEKYFTITKNKNDPEFYSSRSDKVVHDILILHTRTEENNL